MQKCVECSRILFTPCFNFDLNQSASKKKMCSTNISVFLKLSKNISLLVNDHEQGLSGGGEGLKKY